MTFDHGEYLNGMLFGELYGEKRGRAALVRVVRQFATEPMTLERSFVAGVCDAAIVAECNVPRCEP